MLKTWLYRSVIITSLLCNGCATAPAPDPATSPAWAARQAALQQIQSWQAEGRIGVVSGADGWHASFQWAQQAAKDRIDLLGPLGQGRIVVESDAQATQIRAQNGQTWSAADADEALEQSLGVRLPVNGLRYWVRGLPVPNSSSAPLLQVDNSGRLTRLEQNGWVIEYLSYAPTSRLNLELPERITARRTDLSVKLVIEKWNL